MIIKIDNATLDLRFKDNDLFIHLSSLRSLNNQCPVTREDVEIILKEAKIKIPRKEKNNYNNGLVTFDKFKKIAEYCLLEDTSRILNPSKINNKLKYSLLALRKASRDSYDTENLDRYQERLVYMLVSLYHKALVDGCPKSYIQTIFDRIGSKLNNTSVRDFNLALQKTWFNTPNWYNDPHSVVRLTLESLKV